MVFAMFIQLPPLFIEYSHRTTDPTLPDNKIVPVLAVAHTVVSLFVTPATVKLSIVKITVSLLLAQTPLLIVQLKEYTPGTKLVTDVLDKFAFAMVVVVGPPNWLHVPIPLAGLLPFKMIVAGKHTC